MNIEYAINIPGGSFCVLEDLHVLGSMYVFWIPIIVYESMLCLLALTPAIEAFLEGDAYFTNRKLIRVLLRDSVIYFFV